MSLTFSQVLKRFLICIPLLFVGFIVWYSHGKAADIIAGGSMIVLVAFIPGIICCVLCYALYAIVDYLTAGNKLNFIKHFVHLSLRLLLFILPFDGLYSFVQTVTIVIVLIVNVAFLVYDFFVSRDL